VLVEANADNSALTFSGTPVEDEAAAAAEAEE